MRDVIIVFEEEHQRRCDVLRERSKRGDQDLALQRLRSASVIVRVKASLPRQKGNPIAIQARWVMRAWRGGVKNSGRQKKRPSSVLNLGDQGVQEGQRLALTDLGLYFHIALLSVSKTHRPQGVHRSRSCLEVLEQHLSSRNLRFFREGCLR